jgi:hypothetical protein
MRALGRRLDVATLGEHGSESPPGELLTEC